MPDAHRLSAAMKRQHLKGMGVATKVSGEVDLPYRCCFRSVGIKLLGVIMDTAAEFKKIAPYIAERVKERITDGMTDASIMKMIHAEIMTHFANQQ